MSSSYDKLRRILVLEREQGCNDRAVIGGLARFLTYWAKQAYEELGSGDASLTVDDIVNTLAGYAGMPREMRCQTVEQLVARLAQIRVESPAEQSSTPDAAPTEAEDDKPQEELTDDEQEEPAPPVVERPPKSVVRQPIRADKLNGLTLNSPVTTLRGVSTVNDKRLERLGIRTIRDLLYHFPRRYDDFGQLKTINRLALGDEVTVVGVIRQVRAGQTRNGQSVVRVVVNDGTASIEAVWYNQPYLTRQLKDGREIVISGKVGEYLGRLVFTSPEWEPLQRELLHTARLVPVYPLTEGLGGRWLRRLIKDTLDYWRPRLTDPLPRSVIGSANLLGLGEALAQIHFPDNQAALERARRRLSFDEFLLIQLGILRQRNIRRAQPGIALQIPEQEIQSFIASLPFELTGAQQRAIESLMADLQRPTPMNRLLQGDVGSGKTVVAVAAMLATVRNGLQAAMMAPTSILAEQHHRTLTKMLANIPDVRCELLVGSLPESDKQRIQSEIAAGQVHIVVGTHALIQSAVEFDKLGLVVVDEQHRFGVAQRGALRAKGAALQQPLLAMSATPIPRTLALTIYGDLDISALDELPPNRQRIVTAVRETSSRERIYSFINAQIEKGRQAFVICPLVDESDRIDAKSAIAEHQRLQQQIFPQRKVGLLHGRMSADEKEEAMTAFKEGRYDILVSTAVVEVGIDVPNATVILIEGAERFGLAQLHQFRGRVGRGEYESYCILLSDDPSENSLERLRAMEETSDGFVLAEKDMELRGPGDFFGLRQHGLPMLKAASLSDVATLETARAEAQRLFERDPELSLPEHQALAASVQHFWTTEELA